MTEGWHVSVVHDTNLPEQFWPFNVTRHQDLLGGFGDVKNSLLYGTDVVWYPAHVARLARQLPGMSRHRDLETLSTWLRRLREEAQEHHLPLTVVTRAAPAASAFEAISEVVRTTIRDADVLVTDLVDDALAQRHWQAYDATQVLMQALSGLVMPDISALPVEGVADLRGRLSVELEGVRAEMLRLTETLRNRVSLNAPRAEMEREAGNVVRVTVEPVIREASLVTRDLMRRRWARFGLGLAKVFAFGTGAVVLKPDLALNAVQEIVNSGTSVLDQSRPSTAVKWSSRFVLKARTIAAEHQSC